MQLVLQSILAQLVRQEIMTKDEADALFECASVGYEGAPDEVAEKLSRLMSPAVKGA